MQKHLNIALIQSDLDWENPNLNRISFTKKIENIMEDVDLIVLPEMFTTGFTMNVKYVAESMIGDTVLWMKDMASKKNAALTGSLIILEGNNYYNRLLFVEPSGKITHYNKRHAFTLVGENKVFTPGIEKVIIDYKGWKICPLICYDLRFPVWSRNTEEVYDVLLYVANWPIPRISAWNALLKARAIENMSYSIGVNRIGTDGVGAVYNGSSSVYDVLGNKISQIPLEKTYIDVVTLEKKHITKYRSKFKFLDDGDIFTLG